MVLSVYDGLVRIVIALLWIATICCETGFGDSAVDPEGSSLSDIVLLRMKAANDLIATSDGMNVRPCVDVYRKAVASNIWLRNLQIPVSPGKVLKMRRRYLVEQIVILTGGESIRKEAESFVRALPLHFEWEGDPAGPLEEADAAERWLKRHPNTPIGSFGHLFLAHRCRAAFEALSSERDGMLRDHLSIRYRKAIQKAKTSAFPLIQCIANDLDAQSHVYLKDHGRP